MTINSFAQDIFFRLFPDLENKTTYGFINKNKEQTIGIYERASQTVNSYGEPSYSVKRLTILVHWTKGLNACEEMAERIAKNIDRHEFNNGWCEVDTPPIDVGRDENDIFERTIGITIYSKED